MADERTEMSIRALVRWAAIAVLCLAALGAFFAWAPGSAVVLAPQALEAAE